MMPLVELGIREQFLVDNHSFDPGLHPSLHEALVTATKKAGSSLALFKTQLSLEEVLRQRRGVFIIYAKHLELEDLHGAFAKQEQGHLLRDIESLGTDMIGHYIVFNANCRVLFLHPEAFVVTDEMASSPLVLRKELAKPPYQLLLEVGATSCINHRVLVVRVAPCFSVGALETRYGNAALLREAINGAKPPPVKKGTDKKRTRTTTTTTTYRKWKRGTEVFSERKVVQEVVSNEGLADQSPGDVGEVEVEVELDEEEVRPSNTKPYAPVPCASHCWQATTSDVPPPTPPCSPPASPRCYTYSSPPSPTLCPLEALPPSLPPSPPGEDSDALLPASNAGAVVDERDSELGEEQLALRWEDIVTCSTEHEVEEFACAAWAQEEAVRRAFFQKNFDALAARRKHLQGVVQEQLATLRLGASCSANETGGTSALGITQGQSTLDPQSRPDALPPSLPPSSLPPSPPGEEADAPLPTSNVGAGASTDAGAAAVTPVGATVAPATAFSGGVASSSSGLVIFGDPPPTGVLRDGELALTETVGEALWCTPVTIDSDPREVVEHAALDMKLRRRSQACTSVCAQLSYCLHFLGLPEARLDGSGMVTWTHRHSERFNAQPVLPRPMLPASQLMACGSVGQLMAMPVDAHRLMFQNLCSLNTPRNAAYFAITCKALHESLCSMYWSLRCAVWRATDVCRGLRRARTIRAAPVGTVGDAQESDLPLGTAFASLRRNRALVIAFDLGPLEWLPLGPYDGVIMSWKVTMRHLGWLGPWLTRCTKLHIVCGPTTMRSENVDTSSVLAAFAFRLLPGPGVYPALRRLELIGLPCIPTTADNLACALLGGAMPLLDRLRITKAGFGNAALERLAPAFRDHPSLKQIAIGDGQTIDGVSLARLWETPSPLVNIIFHNTWVMRHAVRDLTAAVLEGRLPKLRQVGRAHRPCMPPRPVTAHRESLH